MLRKVEGSLAARRRAVVDDLHRHALARARLRHALVGRAGARDGVHLPARRSVVPDALARRRDHRPLILVPIARRGCTRARMHACILIYTYMYIHRSIVRLIKKKKKTYACIYTCVDGVVGRCARRRRDERR